MGGELPTTGATPQVRGNAVMVRQALLNLLANALKFVRPGQPPEILISCQTVDSRVRLVVADRGIGIDPAFKERVFRPFERLNQERAYFGTGIGLAIVKLAMERMGGSVGFHSQPGKGTTFWLEFQRC